MYVVAAVKYSFAQAGEILPKINAFKQYYVTLRWYFLFRRFHYTTENAHLTLVWPNFV